MAKYERRNGKTPSGGAYSEINYMDDDHNIVDSSEATLCVIRECREDGSLIIATQGFVNGT